MRFESKDLTAASIGKLVALFPGIVIEGKVNFDLLRSLLMSG
jgi:adenine-specific DNA-methyltransferase